jgi:FkbM family methyltransferase
MLTAAKLKIHSVLLNIWSEFHRIRIRLNLTPFKGDVTDEDGLVYLTARITTPLAKRKETVAIPRDNMIFSYVKNYGQWGVTEASFLASLVTARSRLHPNHFLMIDLGAHAGLVTKVFLDKIVNADVQVILVDPLSYNLKAQVHNLKKYAGRIQHCNMAISNTSGVAYFEINSDNIGASRLIDDSSNSSSLKKIQVQTISATNFEDKYLRGTARDIIIKSDLEGIDAQILSTLSEKIWERVVGGVFEIDSSIALSSEETELLTARLSKYRKSLNSEMTLELSEEEFRSILNYERSQVVNLYFTL